MPCTEIVIAVRGGRVEGVWCSRDDAQVTLVDWDIAPGDHDVIQANIGRRQVQAYVISPAAVPLSELAGSEVEAVIEAATEEQVPCQ